MKKGHPFMLKVAPNHQLVPHKLAKGKKIVLNGKEETIHSIQSVELEYNYVTITGYLTKGEDVINERIQIPW